MNLRTNNLYKLSHYYDELCNIKDFIYNDIEEQTTFIVRHFCLEDTMMTIPLNPKNLINLKIREYEIYS